MKVCKTCEHYIDMKEISNGYSALSDEDKKRLTKYLIFLLSLDKAKKRGSND